MGKAVRRRRSRNVERKDVGFVYAKSNDPSLDEKAYDMRNRIYACYILCTSILCLVPVVPYYVSKELYKRGYKRSAAVSMEVFQYSHCALTFSLIFTKVIILLLRYYPGLLDNFFIKNRDLSILTLAAMCAVPVVIFVAVMRYIMAADVVKTTGCSMVEALLARSYLADITQGLPALVCYAGENGPLYTRESTAYKKRYGADIVFDVYLYGTSYLCVLPACFALLCRFFYNKKKRTALSVARVLGVSSHVLITNTLVASLVILVLQWCVDTVTAAGLYADNTGIALLGGVLVSSVLLFVSVAFCYHEISSNVYDGSTEVSDRIAFSVLQFGLLTAAVNCVCSLFRTRAQLKDKGLVYPTDWFIRDLVRRIVSAVLLLPACFLQISSVHIEHDRRRVAAIAKRTYLYSELFLGNLVVFSLMFYALVNLAAALGQFSSAISAQHGLLLGVIASVIMLVFAIAHDFCEVKCKTALNGKKWQEVILEDEDLERCLSNMGVINLLVTAIVRAVCTQPNYQSEEVTTEARDDRREEALPGVLYYCDAQDVAGSRAQPEVCGAASITLHAQRARALVLSPGW
ncbi:hypothetical protein [Candidatus Anaplasma sp. TIGMIC]|uniref:hypothetical protein n=1 Tax=Candidatus Anaplasma sp. TIGMIC TaxID=3020713 RepID=UPI002330064A|nr:hypothetical protein [Candidatus Anaplasma sp. TIGMIC]MDB1135183.1 hypothetical protein [Candidatus Anaplasma sp. TIGMIC]